MWSSYRARRQARRHRNAANHAKATAHAPRRRIDHRAVPKANRPHFTLVLPDLSELTLTRLDRCFDEPIPNPGRGPGQ